MVFGSEYNSRRIEQKIKENELQHHRHFKEITWKEILIGIVLTAMEILIIVSVVVIYMHFPKVGFIIGAIILSIIDGTIWFVTFTTKTIRKG